MNKKIDKKIETLLKKKAATTKQIEDAQIEFSQKLTKRIVAASEIKAEAKYLTGLHEYIEQIDLIINEFTLLKIEGE